MTKVCVDCGADLEEGEDLCGCDTDGVSLDDGDASLVARIRQACAEAFDLPIDSPFFEMNYDPGETPDEALLRIFRTEEAATLEIRSDVTETEILDALIYG